MKMFLKLTYYAFSLTHSKDAMYDEYLLWFQSFQNVIANLSLCVASVCVYIDWIKTFLKLIIDTIFQCVLQKMVG